MMLLHFQDATLRQQSGVVLEHVNWRLETNQHWAILGATGSGKSTLLAALAGQLPIRSGQLSHPVGALREQIELLASDYSFDRRVAGAAQFYQQRFNASYGADAPTVRDLLQGQLRPPGTLHAASVLLPPPAYTDTDLLSVAQQTQITHLLNQPLISLSNGETRRMLLARSLLRKPRILALDMPFSGLDADSRTRLHDTLNHIALTGTTIVLATSAREIPACITHQLPLPEPARTTLTDGNFLHREPDQSAKTEPAKTANARSIADFREAVRMRNVTVSYGEKVVLDGISWVVRRGEKWAISGPNGSGKSTLLSLITADNPQAYRADFDLFDRKRGTGESIWDIKKRIGFVSPEVHLFFPKHLPVWKAVASGLFDAMGLFRPLTANHRQQIDVVLERLSLSALRDRSVGSLSAGQQRWVLLARALVKQPDLLILDEPCQGLDTDLTNRFRDLIDDLLTPTDQTLLYVTHYPDEIPRCVSHVLRLNAGRATVGLFQR